MNKLSLILTGLLFFIAAWAQPADWTWYTSSQGLPNNWVYSITQDGNGDHWFGTYSGKVGKLTGTTWQSHDARSVTLPAYGGYALAADKQGHIWFATSHGVVRYDGSQWTTFDTSDGLGHNEVRAIVVDQAGTRWFATLGGVTRYDGSTWKTFTKTDGLADNGIFSLVIDNNGVLWAGSFTGVSKYNGSQWSKTLTKNWAQSLAVDAQNNLWVGSFGTITKFDGQNQTTFTTTKSDSSDWINTVRAIAADMNGNLWFAVTRILHKTDGQGYPYTEEWHGALKLAGTTWTYYDSSNGLLHNYTRTVYVDLNNVKWFGTDGGVAKYSAGYVSIDDGPVRPAVARVTPNPFQVLLTIDLGNGDHITVPQVRISTPQGLSIKDLDVKGNNPSSVIWDGTDNNGLEVPAGVYIYRAVVGSKEISGKLMKLK